MQRQLIVLEWQQSSVSSPEKESNLSSEEKLPSLRRSQSLITLPNIHATEINNKGIERNAVITA